MSRPKYRTSRQSRIKVGKKRKKTHRNGLIIMVIMVLSAIVTIILVGFALT
ncbi:MAG: hypothetical protein ACFFEN_16750 [Candidatus Thorarchaeota archaeon]